MKIGLKKRILERLKQMPGFVHKGQIETRAKEWGYLGETANRRCREMCAEGILDRKEERGSVLYKYHEKNLLA